jgi:hypothetical protein
MTMKTLLFAALLVTLASTILAAMLGQAIAAKHKCLAAKNKSGARGACD